MEKEEFDGKIPVPQLTRFRLLSLHAEHNPILGKIELKAEVKELFEVGLIGPEKTRSDSLSENKCRIDVTITFVGKWTSSDHEKPIVEFNAKYHGRFAFNSEVDLKQVDSLLATKFYRDSLVAQVYPLAYTHMVGELKLMGVISSRKIGFNPNYDVEKTSVQEGSRPRRKRLSKPKTSAT